MSSPGATGGSAALLTPWFQPSEIDFRLLPSRTVRGYISVLEATVCNEFVTGTRETNTQARYVETMKDNTDIQSHKNVKIYKAKISQVNEKQ